MYNNHHSPTHTPTHLKTEHGQQGSLNDQPAHSILIHTPHNAQFVVIHLNQIGKKPRESHENSIEDADDKGGQHERNNLAKGAWQLVQMQNDDLRGGTDKPGNQCGRQQSMLFEIRLQKQHIIPANKIGQ